MVPGLWIRYLAILICLFPVIHHADPFCDIVAATNIQSVALFSLWSCTTTGVTSSNPCSAPVWQGVICSGSNVISIAVDNALVGTLPASIGNFTALSYLSLYLGSLRGKIFIFSLCFLQSFSFQAAFRSQ